MPERPVFRSESLPAFVGDPATVDDVLREFLAKVDAMLAAIEAAAVAGDGEGLSEAAHKLKGSAAQIMGEALAEACQALITRYGPAVAPLDARLAAVRHEAARLVLAIRDWLAAHPLP